MSAFDPLEVVSKGSVPTRNLPFILDEMHDGVGVASGTAGFTENNWNADINVR